MKSRPVSPEAFAQVRTRLSCQLPGAVDHDRQQPGGAEVWTDRLWTRRRVGRVQAGFFVVPKAVQRKCQESLHQVLLVNPCRSSDNVKSYIQNVPTTKRAST